MLKSIIYIALVLITSSCSTIVHFGNGKLKKVKVDKIDELVEASIPTKGSDSSFNNYFKTENPRINSVLNEKIFIESSNASAGKIQVQNIKKDNNKFFTPELNSSFTQKEINNKPSFGSIRNGFSYINHTKITSIEDRELKIILVILIVAGISALLAFLIGSTSTLSYVLMIISVCALTIAVCKFFLWLFDQLALN